MTLQKESRHTAHGANFDRGEIHHVDLVGGPFDLPQVSLVDAARSVVRSSVCDVGSQQQQKGLLFVVAVLDEGVADAAEDLQTRGTD